ncbi:MAG: RidA family protein [Myxococcota bacterium]
MGEVVTPAQPVVPKGIPDSPAMIQGGLVFTTGIGPVDPASGEIRLAGFAEEARATLDHLKRTLEAAGSSLDRVLKVTVYLQDIRDYRAWNEIYGAYFSAPYPPRACIQAANMPFDVRVQVEAIAHL